MDSLFNNDFKKISIIPKVTKGNIGHKIKKGLHVNSNNTNKALFSE